MMRRLLELVLLLALVSPVSAEVMVFPAGAALSNPVTPAQGGLGANFSASTGVLYDAAGTFSALACTSGLLQGGAPPSCTTTPALGTPASGVATNLTGTASGLTAGTVTTNANLTGDVTSTGNASTLGAKFKVRTCTVIIGDPGAASAVLADDNDSPVACVNEFGADWTITTVACWANAGSPTVTPILTGGTATSILTGALTCGTASWAAGTVQGTAPVVHSFSGTGATCSSTPCTIDVNITTAGGTAKYVVVKITGTL